MVAPTTLASRLTAAAALLILSPWAVALPTTAPTKNTIDTRGIFDPQPVQYNRDVFRYHSDTSKGYQGFSNSPENQPDSPSFKNTHDEMDKIRPNRFGKPQQARPYDEYDGGPLEKRAIWGNHGGGWIWRQLGLGWTARIPSPKEIINWFKFKTLGPPKSILPVYEKPHPAWYDRYTENTPEPVRKRDGGGDGEDEVQTETPTAAPAAEGEVEPISGATPIGTPEADAKPSVVPTASAAPKGEVEATPTPSPEAPVGGGCHH